MSIFPFFMALLLQTYPTPNGQLPPGTYQYSGSYTLSGGMRLDYNSYTVNQNGSITLNLVGGGTFTIPKSPYNNEEPL